MRVFLLFRTGPEGPRLVGVYPTKAEAQLVAVAEAPDQHKLPPGARVSWSYDDHLIHYEAPDDRGTVLFYILERRVLGDPKVYAVEACEHLGVGPPESQWVDGVYSDREGAEARAVRMQVQHDGHAFLDVQVREYRLQG